MRFDVLNPGGTDSFQDFSNGPGSPNPSKHPPINHHAYAACMQGCFANSLSALQGNPLLLLLRGNLRDSHRAARALAQRKQPFFIGWKEAGRHQIAASISHPKILKRFQAIAQLANGFLASSLWLSPLYRAAGLNYGKFIPTPYPIEFPDWDFRIPPEKRSGIFLGTREFLVPSRNHAAALLCACDLAQRLGIHVTCINIEGRRGRALLNAVDANRHIVRIIEGGLSYEAYLKLLAEHQIVLQFDRSGVPGQVAGDAALCGIPAIGSDGSVDHVLNSASSYLKSCSFEDCIKNARRLLTDFPLYLEITIALRTLASEALSFQRGAQLLRALVEESAVGQQAFKLPQ